jgi:hypothetical protein
MKICQWIFAPYLLCWTKHKRVFSFHFFWGVYFEFLRISTCFQACLLHFSTSLEFPSFSCSYHLEFSRFLDKVDIFTFHLSTLKVSTNFQAFWFCIFAILEFPNFLCLCHLEFPRLCVSPFVIATWNFKAKLFVCFSISRFK